MIEVKFISKKWSWVEKFVVALLVVVVKRISRAPIYRTRWEYRALYNLSNTHTDARAAGGGGDMIKVASSMSQNIVLQLISIWLLVLQVFQNIDQVDK